MNIFTTIWGSRKVFFKTDEIIFFDLDYTLLDTKKLKEAMSVEIIGHPDMTAKEIVQAFNNPATKKIVEGVLKDTENFLYPFVEYYLRELRKHAKLVLLSKGGKMNGANDFQNKKITPLKHFFDEVIIVDSSDGKIDAIQKYIENHPKKEMYFINDNPKENEQFTLTFGYNPQLIEVKNYEGQEGNGIATTGALQILLHTYEEI